MNPARGLRSLVRKWVAHVESPPNSSFPRKRESRGGAAGTSRHERLVRKHVPDSDPGWMVPVTFVGLGRPGVRWNPLALVIRTKMCPPINLDAGSPRAKRAEL